MGAVCIRFRYSGRAETQNEVVFGHLTWALGLCIRGVQCMQRGVGRLENDYMAVGTLDVGLGNIVLPCRTLFLLEWLWLMIVSVDFFLHSRATRACYGKGLLEVESQRLSFGLRDDLYAGETEILLSFVTLLLLASDYGSRPSLEIGPVVLCKDYHDKDNP